MKEVDHRLTAGIATFIGFLAISGAAFSRKSKNESIGRSGNRSEISGVSPDEIGMPLHCMHKRHGKDAT